MKVLVLSGGGAKGAYEAGVLKRLVLEMGIRYDAFCGVSVGALNASFLSQYGAGEEQNGVQDLLKFWTSVTTPQVYKSWFLFGRLAAAWKPSVYNSAPLHSWVRGALSNDRLRKSGKQLVVGATSLKTGEYKTWDQTSPYIVDAVLASSAFLAMLLPVTVDGELYTDGGVRDVTPVKAAIDLGATSIDVVMCSPGRSSPGFTSKPTALSVAQRSIDIMSDEVIANDMEIARLINETVALGGAPGKKIIDLRTFRPNSVLTEDSLSFDRSLLDVMLDRGYRDACQVTA